MKRSIGALLLFFSAAMLTACNSNYGISPGPGPTSGPSGNCGGPPSANQLMVVFPRPGARRAPPGLANIYVATKGALPPNNQFNFLLSQSNGSSTFTGVFTQINESQVPTPHVTPPYSNPTWYASPIAGPYGSAYIIGPNQAVSLFWNDGGRNCTPHFLVANFHTR